MKQSIIEITERIIEKSKPTRSSYLQRVKDMQNRTRGADRMGCANVAHAIAALPKNDKLKIVEEKKPNLGIVTAYNDMLSYNRSMSAIDYMVNQYELDRSRFIIKYNGEVNNLIPSARAEQEHFINRRVEFYISDDDIKEQARPDGDGGVNRNWKF